MELLDNPAWDALIGPHADFAAGTGRARRYDPDVSIFSAVDDPADVEAWAELCNVVGAGVPMVVPARPVPSLPEGAAVVMRNDAVQQVLTVPAPTPPIALEVTTLTTDDVPTMLALVEQTNPGPFSPRTHDLGGYIGVWDDGALVAMAGRRFATPDAVEISGVCTADSHRGRGLAAALTARVAATIQAEGRIPFLHTIDTNDAARRVYTHLGFEVSGTMHFVAVIQS